MALTHIAMDQYGQTIPLSSHFPRKELLEHQGMKHASKMYVDLKTGGSHHIGWVIGDRWFRVWKTTPINSGVTRP